MPRRCIITRSIGRVHFDADLDGRKIPAQAKAVGAAAGKNTSEGFDKEWNEGFAKTLSETGKKSYRRWLESGRKDGTIYHKGISERFDKFMADARRNFQGLRLDTGFLDDLNRKFKDSEFTANTLRRQLKQLNLEGEISDRIFASASNQVDRWAEEQREATRVAREHAIEQNRLREQVRQREVVERELNRALDDQVRALRDQAREQERLDRMNIAERTRAHREEVQRLNRDLDDQVGQVLRSNRAFDEYVQSVGGADEATRRIRQSIDENRQAVGAATAQQTRYNAALDRHLDRLDKTAERTNRTTTAVVAMGNASERTRRRTVFLSNAFSSLGDKIKNFGNRGDITPRILVAIILTLGESIASLLSGASAAATAMISSVGVAIGGLGAAALPGIIGLVGAIGLAVNSMRFLKDESPATAAALDQLSATAEASGRRFAAAWGPALSEFLTSLNSVLGDTAVVDAFADAISGITEAFTGVMESPAFALLREQLLTNIPEGIERLGSAAASITEGLIGLAAAAAPYFNELMGMLETWAAGWAEKMTGLSESEGFHAFMQTAMESVSSLLGLLDSVGDFIGAIFMAGAESGNRLIDTLAGVFRGWTDWTQSVEGQNALEEWFANGEKIMSSFGDLLVDVGGLMAQIVTPDSIERMTRFMDAIGEALPGLGEIITLFGELDILNIVVVALEAIGSLLTPLMPVLHEFARAFGENLQGALKTLMPSLERLGEALAPILEIAGKIITSALEPLGQILGSLVDGFASLIETVIPVGRLLEDFGLTSEDVFNGIGAVLDWIGSVLSTFFDLAFFVINTIAKLVRGDFSGAFEGFEKVVSDVLGNFGIDIEEAKKNVTNFVKDAVREVGNFVTDVQNFFGRVGDAFRLMGQVAKDILKNIGIDIDEVINFFKDLFNFGKESLDNLGKGLSDFGRTVANIFGGVINWIKDAVNWFNSLFGAANSATSAASSAGGGGGRLVPLARGTTVYGPTRALIGEAGPEAVVPLRRPLSQVDESVRWLSAIAQGKSAPQMASGGIAGGGAVFEPGSIVVQGALDPRRTAIDVANEIAERAAS